MSDYIGFEIKEKLQTLSYSTKGWSKQFNLVSWNGRHANYDIRDWDENNEKMGRGISLTKEELISLKNFLNSFQIEEKKEDIFL